ncbi:hypothetical protein BDR07DRAFT_790886 [Suillus spraguei]|nr:hypothetical protein BDR07DRAFT_790886 [Suillus spraguei]
MSNNCLSTPTPNNSHTGNIPIVPNITLVATNQREQPQLQGTGDQPPLPVQQGPQPVFNLINNQPPQPQVQAQAQPQAQDYPQAQPLNVAMPDENVAGPSLVAFNGIAKEVVGFGNGYRPPGMPPQAWNVGFHGHPHIPQLWPAYGQHLPAPNYYGGYPIPQAGAPYHGQMHAPAAPQMYHTGAPQLHVNVAPQVYAPAVQVPHLPQQALQNAAPPPPAPGHVPQIPQAVNPRVLSLNQEVPQAPPAYLPPPVPFAGPQYHQQQYQQAVPMVPSAGPAEGSSTRSSKRKAVDDADMPQQKQKRHRPQGDANFELVQPGADGKSRWKCLKLACAHVNPMLEVSVHKHVTATKSHQQDSAVPQAEYICHYVTILLNAKMRLADTKTLVNVLKIELNYSWKAHRQTFKWLGLARSQLDHFPQALQRALRLRPCLWLHRVLFRLLGAAHLCLRPLLQYISNSNLPLESRDLDRAR